MADLELETVNRIIIDGEEKTKLVLNNTTIWEGPYVRGTDGNKYYYLPSQQNNKIIIKAKIINPNIVVPSGFVGIKQNAFKNNTVITSLTLPNTLKTIEAESFYGCSSLTNAVFGNGGSAPAIYIGAKAFYNCENLTAVDFLGLDGNFRQSTVGDNGVRDVWTGCKNLRYVKLTKNNFINEMRKYSLRFNGSNDEYHMHQIGARAPVVYTTWRGYRSKKTGGHQTYIWSIVPNETTGGAITRQYYAEHYPEKDGDRPCGSVRYTIYDIDAFKNGCIISEAKTDNSSSIYNWAWMGVICYGLGSSYFNYQKVIDAGYQFTHYGRGGYDVINETSAGSQYAVDPFTNKVKKDGKWEPINDYLYPSIAIAYSDTTTNHAETYTSVWNRYGNVDGGTQNGIRWIDLMLPVL